VTIETRRFTLSAKQRRAFEAAVDKVERVLARPPGCENQMTDAPYGSLRWVKGKEKIDVPFSGNCVKGRDFDLAVAIFAADAMIDKAAVALRPVERHRLVR
jgi:hypothetical protein